MHKKNLLPLILLFCLSLFSCKSQKENTLTIQASSTPQAEILSQVVDDLKKDGITLKIVVIDDYNIPNRALADGEIDANFFQHTPFLEEQIKQFGYPICILTEVHIEPMGIYSKNNTLDTLPVKGVVTIPSDPTNEDRALRLLEKAGLITIKDTKRPHLTILDIETNPKNLRFQEVDGALLTRTYDEAAAAVIPTNYALLGGLSPLKDALILEDASSLYANVVAIQTKDVCSTKLLALKKYLESEKITSYIYSTYQGAVTPVDHSSSKKESKSCTSSSNSSAIEG